MLGTILQFSFVCFFPAITIAAANRYKVFKYLSPIILCYLTGIVAGNIRFLDFDQNLMTNVTGISIFIAIPLLLFSSDIVKWLKHSKTTFLSFFLGVLGVVTSSIIACLIFRDNLEEAEEVAGMMIGVYTGGTPNMSAIGLSLKVEEETFILLNSADIVFSAIYFIFLLTIAKKTLLLFFPRFKGYNGENKNNQDESDNFKELPLWDKIRNIAAGSLVSLSVVGIGLLFSWLISGKMNEIRIVILTITTLAIACSFIKPVRSIKGTYPSAEYLLLVFAVAMGTMADFSELIKASSSLFYFCGIVVGLSVIIHFLLSFLFRIDADTVIITSTAAIFGPAFIGPVANGIQNREIIVPGITMGLLGYAIGNYVGLATAGLLTLL